MADDLPMEEPDPSVQDDYLLKMFHKYDKNKDGLLSPQEFRKLFLNPFLGEEIGVLDHKDFNNVDYNADGEISSMEFLKYVNEIPKMKVDKVHELMHIFELFDMNLDNTLNEKEAKRMFLDAKFQAKFEMVGVTSEDCFETLDFDHDGKITKLEFIAHIQKLRFLKHIGSFKKATSFESIEEKEILHHLPKSNPFHQ